MNDNIFNILEDGEKLLYESKANVKKTSKQTFRFLVAASVVILFWSLFILGVKNSPIDFLEITPFTFILVIFSLSLLYGILYNLIIKYSHKNNKYFVTSKRIISYNPKKGFNAKDILNIKHLGIAREKNNYGDLNFNFYENNILKSLKTAISFEGIEHPRKVVDMITKINNDIHVYDDKPSGILFDRK